MKGKIQLKTKSVLFKLFLFFSISLCLFNFSVSTSNTLLIPTDEQYFIAKVSQYQFETNKANALTRGQIEKQGQEHSFENKDESAWWEIGDKITYAVKSIPNFFLYGIAYFFSLMASAAAILLGMAVDAESFTNLINSDPVYNSWIVIRDIFNLAFIFVLLFSAFATIFQVEKYHIKKIILMLVIMALLVNFSYPISRFIIDAANIPMYYMLNELFPSGNVGSEFADRSGITSTIVPDWEEVQLGSDIGGFVALAVFMFIFMITILVLAILFLIRFIALILLVIFSPIGFIAAIFPSTKNYADDWWKNLFKYAFFGPIMILMLAIALNILDAFQANSGMIKSSSQLNATNAGNATNLAAWAYYSVPVVVMWMGMIMAQKIGIAGADVVVNKAKGFAKGTARFAGGYIDRKLAEGIISLPTFKKGDDGKRHVQWRNLSKFASPTAWKQAYKERTAQQQRRAFTVPTGQLHNFLNKNIARASMANPLIAARQTGKYFWAKGRGKEDVQWLTPYDQTDWEFAARQQSKSGYAKEISDTSTTSDYVVQQANKFRQEGNAEGLAAALEVLAKENNINDLMYDAQKQGLTDLANSAENQREYMAKLLRQTGLKEEDVAKQLAYLSEVGIRAGHIGLAGMGHYDTDNKKWVVSNAEEQAKAAANKYRNLEPQTRQRVAHPDVYYSTKLVNGKVKLVGLSEVGKEIFANGLSGTDIRQANRQRSDTQAWNSAAYNNSNVLAQIRQANSEIGEEFVEAANNYYHNSSS